MAGAEERRAVEEVDVEEEGDVADVAAVGKSLTMLVWTLMGVIYNDNRVIL